MAETSQHHGRSERPMIMSGAATPVRSPQRPVGVRPWRCGPQETRRATRCDVSHVWRSDATHRNHDGERQSHSSLRDHRAERHAQRQWIATLWPNVLALLVYTFVLVSLSIWRFRKQLS